MRIKAAIFYCALLLCILLNCAGASLAQAPQPAPVPAATPADLKARVTEKSVDASLPADSSVEKMLKAYRPKVAALENMIGKLKGDLRKSGVGAGSLGNFVTDGIVFAASRKMGKPAVLAITNSGGLRKNVITEGELRLRDIFELLPFENALVAFDLTGAQVLDLLRAIVARGDAQSGARVTFRLNADKKAEFTGARLLINGSEKEIDPAAIYTVISIDFLLKVTGGDYAAILRQAKNIRPLGVTLRDAITEYVRTETAAKGEVQSTPDGRFVFDKGSSEGFPK